MCELNYIDSSYFDKYINGKISTAKKSGYDDRLFKPGNQGKIIGDYGTLVNRLYNSEKNSESQYLEFLNAINVDPFAPIENDYD